MDNQEEIDKIKTQAQEVKTLLEEAKQAISDVKSNANNARQVISSIEIYGKKLEEIRALIEDPENGINAHHDKSKTKKGEIDALKASSDEQLSQIKNALATIQDHINQMNEAYTNFTEVNSRVTNQDSGLVSALTNAIKVKGEIDALKASSDEQLSQIKITLGTVQESIQKMTEAYANFTEIKAKIDDPENGLLKTIDTSELNKQEIITIKKDSQALYQEIKKFRDDSHGYTKEIEDIKNTSEENKNIILGYEQESRNFKGQIEQIYKFATDAGLAHAFDTRKDGLKKSTDKWFLVLTITTGVLFGALVLFLWHLIWNHVEKIDGYTWYRLTLTSPLIFLIAFASVQYNKERLLLEKYAFKAATALSLEGYTTLLINTFGKEKEKNEQEILRFVLGSMSTIYQEPHEKPKESKFSFDLNGNFASLRGDFTKTMEETKKEVVETIQNEIGIAKEKSGI